MPPAVTTRTCSDVVKTWNMGDLVNQIDVRYTHKFDKVMSEGRTGAEGFHSFILHLERFSFGRLLRNNMFVFMDVWL